MCIDFQVCFIMCPLGSPNCRPAQVKVRKCPVEEFGKNKIQMQDCKVITLVCNGSTGRTANGQCISMKLSVIHPTRGGVRQEQLRLAIGALLASLAVGGSGPFRGKSRLGWVIYKQIVEKLEKAGRMNRYQSPTEVDRLIQAIAERDRMIVQQLTVLNKNVALLLENNLAHSSGVSGHLLQLGRKQDSLIQIQRELLEIKKNHTGLQTTKSLLTDASQFNPLIRLSDNSVDGGMRLTPPAREVRTPIQTRFDQSALIKEPISPNKAHEADSKTAKALKASDIPWRMALVPFQQKQIIVDISRIFPASSQPTTFKVATEFISKWVAQLYDVLSKEAFTGYFSKYMSEQDTKVFFTHNLAINFERMTEFFWENSRDLWNESGEDLIEHFENESSSVLEFMMVKYPLKQKAYISDEVRNAIQGMNRSDEPEFDILRNTNLLFEYDPTRKNYHRRVKIFLNKIVTESQTQFPKFRSLMKQMFTMSNGVLLSNQTGMKFKENTPLYSQKEIDEDGIEIKTPEVLRIIIKWISELEKKIRGFLDGTLIHNAFSARESEKPEYMNRFMKEYMNEFMNKKEQMFNQASAEMRLRIRSMLNLLPQYFEKYMPHFRHIKPTDVKSGLLSYILAEAASNLSTNYLLFLIDLLEQASKVCKRYQGTVELTTTDTSGNTFKQTVTFYDLEFVTFTISDLLRCKCSGTLADIRHVYEKMTSDPRLTVYRVKNRIDTSNKDFLVNVKLNGTPLLCEVQLAVNDKGAAPAMDEKQEYLNHFSHFMYELSRASYGPIAEAVIINSYLTQFVPFFKEELTKIPYLLKPLPTQVKVQCSHNGALAIPGYVRRNNWFSFVCTNCLSFRVANSSHLDNFDSSLSILSHDTEFQSYQKAKKIICGDCAYFDLLPPQQSIYMLGYPHAYFFQALATNQIPQLIIAVQKSSSVRKINIAQRCCHGSIVSYVPVFYECKMSTFRKELKQLKHEYYLFGLRDDVIMLTVEAERLWKLISPERKTRISTKGRMLRAPEVIGLRPKSPMARKSTLLVDSPRNIDAQISSTTIKLKDLFTEDETLPELSLLFQQQKQLVCSIKHEQFAFLKSLLHMKVQLLVSRRASCVILLSTAHTPESLARLTKHGREFKVGEMKTMQKSLNWKLERSNLDNNSFSVFTDNVDAEDINLVHNNITDLHFIKAKNVKKMDLAGNQIEKINLSSKDFPKLEFLDVSFNSVDTIERLSHDSLEKLFLSVNKIHNLNEFDWNLRKLIHLELTNNQISHFDLTSIGHIEDLHLGDNPLDTIKFPRSMPNLHSLYLFKNRLKTLDMKICQFPSLKKLYLHGNELRRVDLPLYLATLQELVLQGNCLLHLDFPKNLQNLVLLDISSNNLDTLDLTDVMLPNLKQLFVLDNKLTAIYWNNAMPNLEVLNLGKNFLRELDFTRIYLPSLSKLIIPLNYIANIWFSTDHNYPNLSTISASLNPFALPVPSNYPVERNEKFPALETIEVGVGSILECVLWLLRNEQRIQRQRIYEMVEEKERKKQAKWNRDYPNRPNPHPPKQIFHLENIIMSPKMENSGPEVEEEAFLVLELMQDVNLIPQAHSWQIDELLQYVRLTTI